MPKTYLVTGMHCDACGTTVERLLSQVDGVSSVEVDLAAERATVFANKTLSVEELNQALATSPYSVQPLDDPF